MTAPISAFSFSDFSFSLCEPTHRIQQGLACAMDWYRKELGPADAHAPFLPIWREKAVVFSIRDLT
jgi:hypothetical protein